MSNLSDNSLQRLHAALEAQSMPHWWPVLSQWLRNSDGWHSLHAGGVEPDPAMDEVIDLVETGETDSDSEFALTLANLEFARRRAAISRGIRWSPFDGAFAEFMELSQDVPVRTYFDTRTPTVRIAHELLGWALFTAAERPTKSCEP